jgi:signal transduction histidine kinase
MERLRAFYDADTCLFVSVEPRVGEYFLRRVNRRDEQAGTRPELIEAAVGREMLSLPSTHAVVCGRERRWWYRSRTCCAYDTVKGEPTSELRTYIESLAVMFDTSSFVSVPVRYRGDTMGRIYLAARSGCSFNKADADFIFQVIEHIMPIIDNIRLVDRLASDAAEVERQKIALDIHDSIIQPYIGLQIALHGILQKLGPYEVAHASDVERVIQMSEIGVADLRAYVRQLKDAGEREGSLLPAVRRYTVKFAEATGIIVQVEAEPHIRVRDRLAAQVVQMIAEGLSNIRRHTEAIHAGIKLTSCDGRLTVRIEDEGVQGAVLSGAAVAAFTPSSITERAMALGGQVQVERRQDGGSAVIVEIPL